MDEGGGGDQGHVHSSPETAPSNNPPPVGKRRVGVSDAAGGESDWSHPSWPSCHCNSRLASARTPPPYMSVLFACWVYVFCV
eukprot:909291-Rhodomonas_salina.2